MSGSRDATPVGVPRSGGDGNPPGPFLGRDGWARLSETWLDPDLSEPELCFELADRLATYVEVVEAVRRAD